MKAAVLLPCIRVVSFIHVRLELLASFTLDLLGLLASFTLGLLASFTLGLSGLLGLLGY